jgi:hypothetical protein
MGQLQMNEIYTNKSQTSVPNVPMAQKEIRNRICSVCDKLHFFSLPQLELGRALYEMSMSMAIRITTPDNLVAETDIEPQPRQNLNVRHQELFCKSGCRAP